MYILDIRKQNRLPTAFLLNVKRFQHSSDFTKNKLRSCGYLYLSWLYYHILNIINEKTLTHYVKDCTTLLLVTKINWKYIMGERKTEFYLDQQKIAKTPAHN